MGEDVPEWAEEQIWEYYCEIKIWKLELEWKFRVIREIEQRTACPAPLSNLKTKGNSNKKQVNFQSSFF